MSPLLPFYLAVSWALAARDAPPCAEDDAVEGEEEGEDERLVVEEERPDGPDPSATPASVTVIPVDERLSAAADVAAVLDSASGTVVRRLGGLGEFSTISIRGSSSRQVQVYLDGVPLNPDGSASVNLAELPLAAFSRVEIYRGNAPPELAASPVGGVVNLVTGEPTLPAAAGASWGSHRTGRVSALGQQAGEVAGRRSEVMAVAELFTSEGEYEALSDNGTTYNLLDDAIVARQNNDRAQLAAHGRWRLGSERLRLTVLDAFLARDEGLSGPIEQQAEDARLATTRNLAVVAVEGGAGAARGAGRAWAQQRWEDYDDRAGELGTGNQWERSLYANFGALGHGAWAPRPWLAPALTLTARRDSFDREDHLTGEADEQRVRYAGSVTASADSWFLAEKVRFSPAVQVTGLDSRRLGADPETGLDLAGEGEALLVSVDPRAGALWRPWPWLALKANAARSLRPPDFTELFGDQGAVQGNTELDPERGWQWDVGARAAGERGLLVGSADVTHFWSAVRDHILLIQSSQHASVPVNFGRTWTQGVEAAATLSVGGILESQSNLTWTLSRNLSTRADVANKQLPRIPAWELYQGTSLVWRQRARIGHTFSYTAQNYWDAANWFLAPPRALHGAFARASFGGFDAEISALNLLNKTVQAVSRNPLSAADDALVLEPLTDFSGYPLPGRTLLVTLRWQAPTSEEERP